VKRGKSRPEAKEPYFDQFGNAMLREEWQQIRDKDFSQETVIPAQKLYPDGCLSSGQSFTRDIRGRI
ncbi:MAG: hypothetical protein IKP86_10840, partial [Anaerolineaceae bacterium]|nr:hypothetical protein [Anaerolineaceae bacterium]